MVFWVYLKKTLTIPYLQRYSSMLSSRCFSLLPFTSVLTSNFSGESIEVGVWKVWGVIFLEVLLRYN